jgi:streptogramin lyase
VLQQFRRSLTLVFATLGAALLFAAPASATAIPKHSLSFGSHGTGAGQFSSGVPGIAIDAEGNIFAVDYSNGRVEKFSSTGKYLSQFGSPGAGEGQLSAPNGIAIDSKGNMYVSEYSNSRVQEFNSSGVHIGYLGLGSGSKDGQILNPTDVYIDSAGNIWVTEDGNSRVQEFNSKGEFVLKFGSWGTGNGQFKIPSGIAVDHSGNIWVTDALNNRVEKFNSKGEFLLKFGGSGSTPGLFNYPSDIAVDPGNNVWVTDNGNNRVQGFTNSGAYLGEFASSTFPSGLTIDSKGNLWVGDSDHVEKWASIWAANPNWRVEGKTLPELEGWVSYESKGNFQIEGRISGSNVIISCVESGSGTLGFEETMSLSKCKVEAEGKLYPSCEGHSAAPISLDGEFKGKKEVLTTMTLGTEEECPFGENFDLTVSSLVIEPQPTSVNFPAKSSQSGKFGAEVAHVSLTSIWTLTGKDIGKGFGYL